MREMIYCLQLFAGIAVGAVGMVAENIGKALQSIGRKVIG